MTTIGTYTLHETLAAAVARVEGLEAALRDGIPASSPCGIECAAVVNAFGEAVAADFNRQIVESFDDLRRRLVGEDLYAPTLFEMESGSFDAERFAASCARLIAVYVFG